MALDLNSLRKAGVSKKLALLLVANAGGGSGGGGGGGAAVQGMAKLQCSSFAAVEVTTGNGAGAPYTLYSTTLWQPGSAPAPGDLPTIGVVASPSGPTAGFDVSQSGFYSLRYSVIAAFGDDAHTPPWVTYQASTYWNSRPTIGVIPMTTGALTSAFPGSGAPGSSFDVVLPTFYQSAFDAANDGNYYLGIGFKWPGVGRTPANWSITAELARVG